ncbi:MAG TPA: acylphosphatase [Nitrososphaeraceae archaeon]|jgi:acylphosphatase
MENKIMIANTYIRLQVTIRYLNINSSHGTDKRSDIPELVRVHLRVEGKVQGVYFRNNLKLTAIENKVKGWVRNLREGSVEAMLEGDRNDVEKVFKWSQVGPANAIVVSVTKTEESYKGDFSSFEIIDT